MVEWISPSWGITGNMKGWSVVFGDDSMWVDSGRYPNRRRAKKEITHYINKGFNRGPYHGIHRNQ